MDDGIKTAQQQLDMRALEIATAAREGVMNLAQTVDLRFGQMAEWMKHRDGQAMEMKGLVSSNHVAVMTALGELRKDESVKRGQIYQRWDDWQVWMIRGLFVTLAAAGAYIWNLKVGK